MRISPEAQARQQLDAMLARAGWIVQDRHAVNLYTGPSVTMREGLTPTRPADHLLFVDTRAYGVLEAKPKGTTLLGGGFQERAAKRLG